MSATHSFMCSLSSIRWDIIQTELEDVKDWADGYIYKVFDGAWFNTKYAIENTWKDKRLVLLFPVGTYPHSEEQQLQFPLLDILKANMEYKEDDYASFMQQYNLPERFRGFIKKNIAEIMSSKIRRFLMGISIRTHSVRIWFAVLSSPIISARKNCWIGKQSLSR